MHYYNYWTDCENWTSYPGPRFVSEHGFQSFPSFDTYAKVLKGPDDYSRDSEVLDFRQRHKDGNEQVLAMLERHFKVPDAASDDPDEQQRLFDEYCWLTQVRGDTSCFLPLIFTKQHFRLTLCARFSRRVATRPPLRLGVVLNR